MHNPALVRVFQCFANLLCNRQSVCQRDRRFCDAIDERRSFHQLHNKRMHAGGIFKTINRCNVRVIQRGQDFGFAFEPARAFCIASQRFRQDFERNLAPEFGVPGAIHLAHAAGAERGDNFIRPKFGPRGEPHTLRVIIVPWKGVSHLEPQKSPHSGFRF